MTRTLAAGREAVHTARRTRAMLSTPTQPGSTRAPEDGTARRCTGDRKPSSTNAASTARVTASTPLVGHHRDAGPAEAAAGHPGRRPRRPGRRPPRRSRARGRRSRSRRASSGATRRTAGRPRPSRPRPSAATVSVTRWISVTTCRARRRTRSSGSASTTSSVAARRVGTPSARAALSQSARRDPYPPSVRAWETRVSVTSSVWPARSSGTTGSLGAGSKSMSSAAPRLGEHRDRLVHAAGGRADDLGLGPDAGVHERSPHVGVSSTPSEVGRATADRALERRRAATARRRAAPVLSTSRSTPGTAWPASRSAQTTPTAYAGPAVDRAGAERRPACPPTLRPAGGWRPGPARRRARAARRTSRAAAPPGSTRPAL